MLATLAAAATTRAASPTTHRLEATPSPVAYGYYWAAAPPVLRIASGDIIDVDTLLTNTPAGLAKAGVADERIQPSLKAIVAEVTGERRDPLLGEGEIETVARHHHHQPSTQDELEAAGLRLMRLRVIEEPRGANEARR
ncbi:MAG TPA: hypothetical protein VMG33_13390, partial [Steroidobacteraceae bacterium]|nr:hypothetical protein [Steroidobacteraceae bacterium]